MPRSAPPVVSWPSYWDDPQGVDVEEWQRDVRAFVDAAAPVLALSRDDDVLDVGCGPGFALEALVGRVRTLTGADVAPRALESARARLAGRGDVALLLLDPARPDDLSGLGDRRFTVVLCHSVLQYLPSLDAVDRLLGAIRRVCAPGARVLLSDLPTGGGRWADAWGLLRGARRQGRLLRAWGRLARLRTSAYRDVRARLGLLAIDVDRLFETARALGGRPEELRAPLSILANRRHVLLRF